MVTLIQVIVTEIINSCRIESQRKKIPDSINCTHKHQPQKYFIYSNKKGFLRITTTKKPDISYEVLNILIC
jgi:hypothetical protein